MSARDLPGIGDTSNPFGYVPPNSPDFVDHDDEARDATEANIEALGEWLETFQAAARLHDRRRMEQARLFAVSLMDGLIEAAR